MQEEAELELVACRKPVLLSDRHPVGRDSLRVLPGVRVASLDRIGQGPHGRGVGLTQLLGALALLLERLAQVSGVALELVLLFGSLLVALLERALEALDLFSRGGQLRRGPTWPPAYSVVPLVSGGEETRPRWSAASTAAAAC